VSLLARPFPADPSDPPVAGALFPAALLPPSSLSSAASLASPFNLSPANFRVPPQTGVAAGDLLLEARLCTDESCGEVLAEGRGLSKVVKIEGDEMRAPARVEMKDVRGH
jgi:hypothetical protein